MMPLPYYRFRRLLLGWPLALSLAVAASLAAGAEPPWTDESYTRYSDGEALSALLRNIAASQGIPAVISERVDGEVNGRFSGLSAQAVFNDLVEAFDLIWYYDGHALYIYRADEVEAEVIRLNHLSVERLRATLTGLGLLDKRVHWQAVEDEGIIFLSGPARYIEVVQETVAALDQPQIAPPPTERVYKWVDNHGRINYSSNQPSAEAGKTLAVIPVEIRRSSGRSSVNAIITVPNRAKSPEAEGAGPGPASVESASQPN